MAEQPEAGATEPVGLPPAEPALEPFAEPVAEANRAPTTRFDPLGPGGIFDRVPADLSEQGPSGGTLDLIGEEADPERRQSNRRRWIAAAVAGAAFVGGVAVAAMYGPTAYEIFRQKDTTLSAPVDVAGLRLDDSPQAADTADYLRTALAADLGLGNPLGAVYSDPAASSRSVIIVGGTGLLRVPEKDLARAFDLFADGGSRVTDIHDVDAGALGGVMRCGTMSGSDGTTSGSDVTMAVCGWADHGALAIAMFPGRTPDNSAALLRDLRSTIQHRD